MPAYVLIRETKKERRAPLRACIAAVAGLGLGAATLGGAAYGPALAGGLLGFVPFLAPILVPGHEPRATEGSDHVIRIKADANGHYFVKGNADGVPLEFMIDTGASYVTLTKEVAGRLSVGPLNFNVATNTANGPIQNAQITIGQLTIGSFNVIRMPAVVNGGNLDEPLLGMSWLGLFKSIEIQNGVMTLHY